MHPRLILDCDPGHDDAIAMLVAAGSGAEILAITTVHGNQTIDKVTRNALAVAEIAGLTGVPIAAGCDRPLTRQPMVAPEYHGESGLDGPQLPEPSTRLDERHAVDVIVEVIMREPAGTVTLVPTGALTNIAMAARREPRIVERVRQVVLMGGAAHGGNLTPVAEYNIAIDPEAAEIVFGEAWTVVMAGLDVTHQALATDAVAREIAELGTRAGAFVGELLDFFTGTYREQGFEWPPVHDVCAVAIALQPDIFDVRSAPIGIETRGELTTGMTVVDLRHPAPADCTTSVVLGLDVDRFWALVIAALGRLR